MKGLVLYKGPSKLTGDEIVVILTLNSANRKTGDMAQTWILNADISPVDAIKQKQTESICGSCPLQQANGGACYVNVGQAPLSIWRAWRKGQYAEHLISEYAIKDEFLNTLLRHKRVRFGAYGDPAAVPTNVWSTLAESARGHTGYTHQFNHPSFDKDLAKYCMISVDTAKQAQELHATAQAGDDYKLYKARTFRVITQDAPLLPNEIVCPSSDGIECRDCLLCDGAGSQPNIAIEVHGRGSKKHNAKYSNANLIEVVEL